MANRFNSKPTTLCVTCKTPSPTCPWKYNFTPVEGWEVEPSKVKLFNGKYSDSYIVKSCPLYEENKREPKEKIELPKSKYKLINDIMKAKRRKEQKLGD